MSRAPRSGASERALATRTPAVTRARAASSRGLASASGELLAELQRIKATGDREALKALVESCGTRINPAWRDEVLARLKALNLPRVIATVPPMITPVRDAGGKIVDATAEQTTSLDAYIAAMERVWAG
ncbi:hypothetical protein WME75_45590 [Sorangium sp. So ce1014]|uniref:hypothetical protein n=1 Tax=Sorangium sp. So ce1014 TaxID=3133326 RepID=UPI003F5EE5B6